MSKKIKVIIEKEGKQVKVKTKKREPANIVFNMLWSAAEGMLKEIADDEKLRETIMENILLDLIKMYGAGTEEEEQDE